MTHRLLTPVALLFAILIGSASAASVQIAGYLGSDVTTQGGNQYVWAYAPDATRVEFSYEGTPLGVFLNPDGGGVHSFVIPFGPGSPGRFALELLANGTPDATPRLWPYLTVEDGASVPDYLIVTATNPERPVAFAASELAKYLRKITGGSAAVRELASFNPGDTLAGMYGHAAFVVNPQAFSANDFPAYSGLPEEGIRMEAAAEHVYLIGGEGQRGVLYAVYRFLYEHGVRFLHPEDEWLPGSLSLRYPFSLQEQPGFKVRGYTFHTTHPLEINDALDDPSVDLNLGINLNTYMVKQYSNIGGKGGSRPELGDLVNNVLGFRKGSGISLHGTQQGGRPDVDWTSGVPVLQQIREHIDSRLAGRTDIETFGIGFGPTEYTTTEDTNTVFLLNYCGTYVLDNYPGVQPVIGSHITGGEPSPNYNGTDYRDLGIYTDRRIGIQWHTVMFYDLFGPAPCYRRQDFNQKYAHILQEANHPDGPRYQVFYPETSYWLSFDNALPMFYPVYMYGRYQDFKAMRELTGKGMAGHKVFTTGQEWGYWMGDYLCGQMQWNPDLNWTDVVADFTIDIMGQAGPAVHSTLTRLTRYQYDTLVMKKLTQYLSGEDEIDELGELLQFQAQQIRPAFKDVFTWDLNTVTAFQNGDLNEILMMSHQYERFLGELDSVRAQVEPRAMKYFDEIYDGTEIDMLRCRHIYRLYRACVTRRLHQLLDLGTIDDSMLDYNAALAITGEAIAVIHRREQGYRYDPYFTIAGGLTEDTAIETYSTFGYRLYYKAHIGFYWQRRDEQAYEALTGLGDPFQSGFYLKPAISSIDSPLEAYLPAETAVVADLNFGDGAVGNQTMPRHTYAGQGVWNVRANVTTSEGTRRYSQWVGRAQRLAYSPSGQFTIVQPENPLVNLVLGSLMRGFQFGLTGAVPTTLIVGMDLNYDHIAESFTTQIFPIASTNGSAWETAAGDMNFAIPYGDGSKIAMVKGHGLVLSGTQTSDSIASPVRVEGGLEVQSIVHTAVNVGDGALDETNIRTLLAQILGVPVDQLPDHIVFAADFAVQPN